SKARAGQIKHFTGIDSSYEEPESPDLDLNTIDLPPETLAERVLEELRRRKVV
ncbi:adenylyl-sulfate kinase, partial [Methyloceanibacter sp.]